MSNRLLAGRYELIEKIGEGGMAIVYKGRDRLLNRYVAIKILRPEFIKDEAFIDNFRKESQAAAGLTHPNVVSVYDVGKEGNIHFIVMELVEGKTLSQIIEEKGRLDYKEAIEITKQVASALSLAHKNQIIHRDVKPHNILITGTGVAKLADFGIARAVSSATLINGTSKVMGSVHYLSPEQARGSYIDERTDIYSLGIVLYEMLTGQVPFDGDNPISIALMHINEPMTPPSKVVSGIPPQLEKVILKATDKYQNNRYSSADEMIQDLDDIDFITKVMGKSVFMGKEDETQFVGTPENIIKAERTNEELEVELLKAARERDTKNDRKNQSSKKTDKTDADKRNRNKIISIAIVAVLVIGAGIFGLGTMMGWFGDSEEIEVPDLTGRTLEEAAEMLEERGLILEEGEEVYSPDQEKGKITTQTPVEGSKVKEGAKVTVNVSRGKKDDVVPSITGKDWKDAEAYLKELGFEIGIVKEETSEKPKDTIISQDPEAGSSAPEGTKINIIISDGKGKTVTKVPNLANLTPEQANAALAAANLTADPHYEESDKVDKNKVIRQDIPFDTEVEVGTTITYYISKGVEPVIPPDDPDDNDPGDDDPIQTDPPDDPDEGEEGKVEE
ncbi:MAG: Stk1 family PASTA domain-containing Ser/Thr kinase [Firmicutes bacterium]|nr:Stk1 family PASTA domain-containing Ser/Thr kinase [Bacillota bacterium]